MRRWLGGALVTITAASIAYQVATVIAAARWRRTARAVDDDTASDAPGTPTPRRRSVSPRVSVLKPVHGVDPHAESCFASFCNQDYPEYEILFGVADPDDPAAEIVRRLCARYPAARIRLVETGSTLGPNRKVCNLEGLAAAARHELLLVSDSDMRVTPDYLRCVTAPFHDPRIGLVTCPYRGQAPEGLAAALEALGIAAGFMPGVFVAALGRPAFAFGSTIALRRDTLARIGGFAGLVDYLADDFQMGKRVADLGLRVHLSSVVVDTVLGRRSLRESWARRLRWARTVRACRPLGHLGSGLTHTTALALLTTLALGWAERASGRAGERASGRTGSSGVWLLGLAMGVRLTAAWRVAVVQLQSESAQRCFPLLLVSDLVEAALWVGSFLGRSVLWRGQRYRLLEGGRIERIEDDEPVEGNGS